MLQCGVYVRRLFEAFDYHIHYCKRAKLIAAANKCNKNVVCVKSCLVQSECRLPGYG